MNKPLTKEERNNITISAFESVFSPSAAEMGRVLESEAYWREAVRNVDACGEIGRPCPFCEVQSFMSKQVKPEDHRPNCPWRIANE